MSRLILYCHVLFFSFFIVLVAGAATSQPFHNGLAAGKEQWVHKDDDGNNANEDFEEQNSIQICCAWGYNLVDGILTYYIDKEGSNEQQQDEARDAVQEWDRNIEALELEETSNKKNGDILIEFQERYEGYDKQKGLVAGESINTFDTSGFIHKVRIIVYKAVSDLKFDEGIVERIVKHEMGHALGLGHANFDGNLMAEKIDDGTRKVTECEIEAISQANYWKFIADGTHPDRPESNRIICNE